MTRRMTTCCALASLLVIALYFRSMVGLFWDEGEHLHPDERFLTMVTERIALPSSIGEYFNSQTSPLSPYNNDFGFFVYGTLPIFVTKYVAAVLGLADYGHVHIVGRVMNSVFELLSLFTLYLFGSRVFNRATGLTAALLFAIVPQNIQLSHFYGVESAAAFFVLLSFLLSTEVLLPREAPRPVSKRVKIGTACVVVLGSLALVMSGLPSFVAFQLVALVVGVGACLAFHASCGILLRSALLGLTVGCALACKISTVYAIPFIFLPLAVEFLRSCLRKIASIGSARDEFGELPRPSYLVLGGIMAVFIAALGFRVFQPYAFEGTSILSLKLAPKFLSNMSEVKGLMKGADFPPSVYWVDQPAFLFHWRNMLWWQMGLGWFVAAWGGLLFVVWRLLKAADVVTLPWVAWTVFWFSFNAISFAKAGRYLSLIYPFFALAGGCLLVAVTRAVNQSVFVGGAGRMHARVVALVPASIVVVSALIWAIAVTNIYRRPHTRIAASRWIYANIPCGSTLANEHWDDGLPLRVDGKDGFGACYKGLEFEHYHWDDSKKLASTLSKLQQTDYIILSSNRLSGSIPRMPRRFPFTTEYYRMLFSGELGFALEKIFTSYPSFGPFELKDDTFEELLLNYDHPKVLIFKKTPNFDFEYVSKKLRAFPPHVPLTLLDQQT
jgi:4-amino-4-deoxy-L-arabinose transferase-like glycosyltransferase